MPKLRDKANIPVIQQFYQGVQFYVRIRVPFR